MNNKNNVIPLTESVNKLSARISNPVRETRSVNKQPARITPKTPNKKG